jgi:hypothetical protein
MSDNDLERRVRDLGSLAIRQGEMILDQQQQIDRLRQELGHELTSRAIESLRPWPAHVERVRSLPC